MKRIAGVLALLALTLASCRTVRPPAGAHEGPIAALTSTNADDALRQLSARRAQFAGARSFVRIRATSGDNVQTFRGQLQLDAAGHMLLTAYTPLNTSAMRLYAEGDRVTLYNDLNGTKKSGSAAEVAKSVGFFTPSLLPSDLALLLLGLPPSANAATYVTSANGLARATAGDVVVTYDPAVFPPQHVTVERPGQKLEVEHLELVTSDATVQP